MTGDESHGLSVMMGELRSTLSAINDRLDRSDTTSAQERAASSVRMETLERKLDDVREKVAVAVLGHKVIWAIAGIVGTAALVLSTLYAGAFGPRVH